MSVPGRLGLDTGAVAKYTGFSADTISAGWHHLVVRSSVGQSQFYLDSTLVGTVSDHINLEVSSVGNGNVGGFKFSPKMDDFRVYGRTLSVNEIISLYGNGDEILGYILIMISLQHLTIFQSLFLLRIQSYTGHSMSSQEPK